MVSVAPGAGAARRGEGLILSVSREDVAWRPVHAKESDLASRVEVFLYRWSWRNESAARAELIRLLKEVRS